MRIRPLAVLAAAMFLTVLVPTSDAQDTKPDHCTPVSLSAYPVYSQQNVRAVWDSYSVDSRGVCEWRKESGPNTMPACRYGVQLSTPTFGQYGILCWWGYPAQKLSTTLAPRDMQTVIEDILKLPAVKDRLGPGTLVIELQVGDETVTIVTRDGKVATIEGKLAPPAKCYTTYLGGYREYNDPAVKKTWDAYSSDSIGVCRWDTPDRPTGECNHMVEFAGAQAGIPTYWLCWWGKLVKVQQAGVSIPPDITVSMSRDTWLAVANSASPGDTLLWAYKNGNVAIKFRDPARQAAAKLGSGIALGEVTVPRHQLPSNVLVNGLGSPYGIQGERLQVNNLRTDARFAIWDGVEGPQYLDLGPTAGIILAEPEDDEVEHRLWLSASATLLGHLLGVRHNDTTIEPPPSPGTGAGWTPPADNTPSVLDEIDEKLVISSNLELLLRHGREAARFPEHAIIDEWSRGKVA